MTTYKMDIDNFEYRKTYYAPEHKWCHLYTEEGVKKFYDDYVKQELSRAKRNRVQSDPETTGQHGTMI